MPDNQFASWRTDKDFVLPTFKSDTGGICVRVSILDTFVPRYSYAIGWRAPDGDLKRNIQPNQIVNPSDLSSLLTDAQAYLKQKIKEVEDLVAKREADRKAALALDQERKQARKKRHEDNQQRRAEENRTRSRGGSGKKGGKQ